MRRENPDKVQQAVTLFQSGLTVRDSASKSGISSSVLHRAIVALDIPVPSKRWVDKSCLACGEIFRPTNGRQIVCTRTECKDWRKANPDIKPQLLRDVGDHGIEARYVGGCRCSICVKAHNHRKGFYRHEMMEWEYEELLRIQGGTCGLCSRTANNASNANAFDVDHSHACIRHTNDRQTCRECWRGLLCRECNHQLEGKVGHAYIREMEGADLTEEDIRVLDYVRNPPANFLRQTT